MTLALGLAALTCAIWIYLVLFRGMFWLARERDDHDMPATPNADAAWPRVAAIVPARNEADMLPLSLPTLLAQDYPHPLTVIVVDDQSEDGTSDVAHRVEAAGHRPVVIAGAPRPPGWTGKVWAQSQGVAYAAAMPDPPDYLLLTDADIAYAPDTARSLVARARASGLVLTSLMAKLNCDSAAERALIPAFIFFFQMLYPFASVARRSSPVAGAAGGCMLVERRALEAAGGLAAIRNALIDDCSLAAVLKCQGPIWLGLTGRAISLRPYPHFADIRHMVSRSAYAQLRYSPLLLAGTVAGMALTYLAPPLLAFFATGAPAAMGVVAWLLMAIAFQPTLRFYRASPLWGLALPGIAVAYTLFTLDSAYQHWRGRGGMWKGRAQALPERQ